uniref:Uncharacterized protein n=1 Tax=Cucumis sativus TaxID=3659 RepID=A0A0A0KDR6_CUCSA
MSTHQCRWADCLSPWLRGDKELFCHLPKDATGRVEQAVAVPGSHPACCSPPKAGNWKLNVIAVWPKEKSCKFTNKNWSISLLKAVALVEGLNAIELEWSGLNPPFEVEFDALEGAPDSNGILLESTWFCFHLRKGATTDIRVLTPWKR